MAGLKYPTLKALFTAICDSVRAKEGTTELINHQDLPERIDAIESSGDTSVEDGLMTRTLTEYENDRITTLGEAALRHCISLTKVDLPNVTYVDEQAFFNCSNLVDVNMPKLERIGAQCFQNCTKLKTISLPNLKRIESANNFTNCTALVDVDLPLLEYVNHNVFYQCKALRVLRLPSLKTITTGGLAQYSAALHTVELNVCTNLSGNNNFNRCTGLNCIILKSETLCSLANINTFASTPFRDGTGGIAYVPSALIESYEEATNWGALESISYRAIEDWSERIDITTQPVDKIAATGEQITFNVAAEGMGLEYQWETSVNGNAWVASNTNSGITANYIVNVRNEYNGYKVRCKITNSEGYSVVSNEAELTVTE